MYRFCLCFLGLMDVLWAKPLDLNPDALSLYWCIPFAGTLLSIALFPLIEAVRWHRHYGKITAIWSSMILFALWNVFGGLIATHALLHTLCGEYVPFICLIGGLYVINSGLYVHIRGQGGPFINALIMLIGALLANVIGTTGASLLLIHPLIRMNAWRKHRSHTIVFFIFLVCNIGGALTAIGDPPLFLGFLNGVDFFWPTTHLWPPTLFMISSLLLIYVILDGFYFRREQQESRIISAHAHDKIRAVRVEGVHNLVLLVIMIGSVILSGVWKTGHNIEIFGCTRSLESLIRDGLLLMCAVLSLKMTPAKIHEHNHFSWEPIQEVVILFVGIFITAIPVFMLIGAGSEGPFAPLLRLMYQNGYPSTEAFFWATGALSSFLDNAPTYMVFFHMAGGDAQQLMGEYAHVLAAISCGAVYMGAMTYIGNAPNFMMKSIAQKRGILMPSFFGYMVWSCLILLPLFYVADVIIQWW